MNNYSYVAANSIPVKMFKSKDLMKELNNKWIVPIHVQLIHTNKCNLKCKFCSCLERKKDLELSLEAIEEIADNLSMVHCAAVTITGGGEPLLHPKINEIIDLFYHRNIKIGLVTNGYLASRLSKESWYKITWCRISGSDDRPVPLKMLPIYDKIDWAFSYVVTQDFKPDNLLEYINFANNNGFTHVRVVSDILDDKLEMFHVKQLVTKSKINTSKVIFQDRSEYTSGIKNCYISLLKPNIAADGFIYPCCGVQYALDNPSLDFPESMRMGHYKDLFHILHAQRYFNGSVCKKCFYSNYNNILQAFIKPLKHEEFV